jgi:hypothetical protein
MFDIFGKEMASKVLEYFSNRNGETENTHEHQKYRWQCILDTFKKYSESVAQKQE